MSAQVELATAKFYVEPAELASAETTTTAESALPVAELAPPPTTLLTPDRAIRALGYFLVLGVAIVFGMWVFDGKPAPKATAKSNGASPLDALLWMSGSKGSAANNFAKHLEKLQDQLQDDLQRNLEEQTRRVKKQEQWHDQVLQTLQSIEQMNRGQQAGQTRP